MCMVMSMQALDENVMLDAMWSAADQIGIEYQVLG